MLLGNDMTPSVLILPSILGLFGLVLILNSTPLYHFLTTLKRRTHVNNLTLAIILPGELMDFLNPLAGCPWGDAR